MAKTADKPSVNSAVIAQIMFRNASGYPQGQDSTPDVKSSPQTDSAYVIEGLIEFTEGAAVYPKITNLAGGNVRNKTPVSATDYGAVTFTLSEKDETLDAMITASTVDVATNTAAAWTGRNVSRNTFPTFMVVLSALHTEEDGTEGYIHFIYPNCTVTRSSGVAPGQVTGDVTNPNPIVYELDLALSLRDVTGYLFSATAMALNDNQDARIEHRTTSRVAYTTYTADGVATSFILGYRPTSTDATGGVENNITIDGVKQAVTSVTAATGVVSIVSPGAGSDGDIYCVEYATDFEAI